MLSIERCRQILGATAARMTDAQVDRLRRELYGLADIAVSCFMEQHQQQRKRPAPPAAEGAA